MGIKSFLREMGTDVCIWCRWITVLTLALLYVGRLVSGFSPQRLALDPASISVRFVVDKGALEQVSLTLFRFSLVTIIPLILHNSSFPITYSCQKDKRRKLQTLKVLFRRSCSSEQEKKNFRFIFFHSSEWNFYTSNFVSFISQFQSHLLQDNSWWYVGCWSTRRWLRSPEVLHCVGWIIPDISKLT